MTAPAREYAAAARYVLHERGTRHLVLLLHGLGGDRNQPLELVRDQLAGVSVLAPDARAHGDTMVVGAPAQFTTAALAADALALVDRLGLHDRILIPVGISMGAAVGLELLTTTPARVGGAVLIRPSFGPQPWPDHLRVFRTIAALLRANGAAGAAAFAASAEYERMRAASASAAASLLGQFEKPHARERVVRLETVPANTAATWTCPWPRDRPVTVVAAEGDPGHPRPVAQWWHRQLAGSRLAAAPSRDEHPVEYAAALEDAVVRTVREIVG